VPVKQNPVEARFTGGFSSRWEQHLSQRHTWLEQDWLYNWLYRWEEGIIRLIFDYKINMNLSLKLSQLFTYTLTYHLHVTPASTFCGFPSPFEAQWGIPCSYMLTFCQTCWTLCISQGTFIAVWRGFSWRSVVSCSQLIYPPEHFPLRTLQTDPCIRWNLFFYSPGLWFYYQPDHSSQYFKLQSQSYFSQQCHWLLYLQPTLLCA